MTGLLKIKFNNGGLEEFYLEPPILVNGADIILIGDIEFLKIKDIGETEIFIPLERIKYYTLQKID